MRTSSKTHPRWKATRPTGPETAIAETMFLGLRLLEGMTLSDFQQRHDIDLLEVYGTEVDDLVAKGLLGFDGECLKLTGKGLLLSNQVFLRFID